MAEGVALDERARRVLARLEEEDARERAEGVPRERRSRQVEPTTGRFLLALAGMRAAVQVLEIGGSRGYSTIWLAAGARLGGGHVLSLERDPEKCAAWRRNLTEAGLDGHAELVEDDARQTLAGLQERPELVFLDAEKEDYEALFALVRPRLRPGAVVVADNVLSHAESLGAYSAARQADATLSSVTVPLDRGLEVTIVLAASSP